MVLLHRLGQLPANVRPQLTVAHLNHGLRKSESDADQRLVSSICDQWHLPFVTKTLDSDQIANTQQQTIEEAARSIRYRWLEETAQKTGATAIVTGHHADDQAETVAHHLVRGTGVRGLQGMLPVRTLPTGIRLLRPLLGFSRKQLRNYASFQQIAFREDATNVDTAFTRNKIRHDLIPQINSENQADVTQSLTQLAASAADTVQVLDEICQELATAAFVTCTSSHVLIAVQPFANLPDLIQSHFFTWLWIQQAWPRQKMTSAHWQRLSAAVRGSAPLRFQLPGRVDVTRERQWMRLVSR